MFTDVEYANAACEANSKGLFLYVKVANNGDETLLIAPVNYYVCAEGTNRTDGTINANYEQERIEELRENLVRSALSQANQAIELGYVHATSTATVETNAQTVADIASEIIRLEATGTETCEWLSREDIYFTCTATELKGLIALIGQYKSKVWEKYYDYIGTINSAETYEELESIEIDYMKGLIAD